MSTPAFADLAAGSSYYVNIGAGVFRDLAGNSFAGISGPTAYSFTTATTTATDDYPWATSTNGVVVVNGSTTSGVIEVTDDADLFKVTLTAGTTYVFDLVRATGGLADPYLRLYGPTVELVAFDDDSGGAQNSRISYTAAVSGTYYLGAMDYGNGTGAYTVTAAAVDTSPPTLTGSSPADNASGVSPGANLVLSLNETVQAGSGSFIIYNANGSIARTIAVRVAQDLLPENRTTPFMT